MKEQNPKDLRVIRTKILIRAAFIELIQEEEFNKITVNVIAQRAGINRVTFYLHYKDLQDMIDRLVDEKITEIETIFNQKFDNESFIPGNELKPLICLLEYISQEHRVFKVFLVSKRIPMFTQYFLELLSKMILENELYEYRSDIAEEFNAIGVPKDIAAWYGASAIVGTISLWLGNDMPYSPHYLAKQIVNLSPFEKKGKYRL